MAKKYPDELKQRAKDYVQVHGYNFEKVSEILDIPLTTINDWSRKDINGKWIKSKYKAAERHKRIRFILHFA